MRDSVTYQAIVEEGRAQGLAQGRQEGRLEEARDLLLLVGTPRLGSAPAAVREALGRIDSLDRLHSVAARVHAVESWAELLRDG